LLQQQLSISRDQTLDALATSSFLLQPSCCCRSAGSSPPADSGQSLQLEEHTPHPQQQLEVPVLAVDLQLDQLCIYASQRRLCITAALVKAFQEVQEGLLLAARPRTTTLPVEVAPTPKVQALLFTLHSLQSYDLL